MFKQILIVYIGLFLLIHTNMMATPLEDSTGTNQRWQNTVKPYLDEPLWTTELSYNAGHFLMVPMHAAFDLNKVEWQQDFAKHFERFADTGYNDMGKTLLYRIHYLYLASQFLVLCQETHADSLIPPRLYDILFEKINKTWNQDEIWQWKYAGRKSATFKNMRSKVLWKLYNPDMNEKIYYRSIMDDELFTMAIAADLKRYLYLKSLPPNNVLDDMTQMAVEVFQQRAQWNSDGGWLLQPGYWSQYEDFAYAGNDSVHDSLQRKEVKNIAEDVSHSLRLPLWICSFQKSMETVGPNYTFFSQLKKGLEIQLFKTILVLPTEQSPYYLAHNFMDGHNGVYRYHYNNRPGGSGPYELSAHLCLGWWSFLGSERTQSMYKFFDKNDPFAASNGVAYYRKVIDPKGHLVKNIQTHEMCQLIATLAASLPLAK